MLPSTYGENCGAIVLDIPLLIKLALKHTTKPMFMTMALTC